MTDDSSGQSTAYFCLFGAVSQPPSAVHFFLSALHVLCYSPPPLGGQPVSLPRQPHGSMAARVGFSATISREPRQARKGATVTVISGAGEVPARAVSIESVAACRRSHKNNEREGTLIDPEALALSSNGAGLFLVVLPLTRVRRVHSARGAQPPLIDTGPCARRKRLWGQSEVPKIRGWKHRMSAKDSGRCSTLRAS